ncbi:Aquaporin-1 [Pleosporales sp. CAS-2024a]
MAPPQRNVLPVHNRDIAPPSRASHQQTRHGHRPHTPHHIKERKNALSGFVSNKWRNELVASIAEFAGTFMFLFFSFGGTQVANTAAIYSDQATSGQQGNSITQAPNTSVLLYISLIFGFSLMVTLGLFLIGAVKWDRAIICFFSQMLAGMAAAGVVSAILPGPLNVSTTLGNGVTPAMGVFLEMFLTSLLVFTIFMLAAEKHKATFLAPVGIGLALFVAEMVGVFFTGGSLNPSRSFGPCVVTRKFPSYHYIYWFGPVMGTLLAFGMYKIVKVVEYQTVNPGQDFDDHEAAAFKPPEDAETADQVERPNVAAIALEEAMRAANLGAAAHSQDEEEAKEHIDGRGGSGSGKLVYKEKPSPEELLKRTGHVQ